MQLGGYRTKEIDQSHLDLLEKLKPILENYQHFEVDTKSLGKYNK